MDCNAFYGCEEKAVSVVTVEIDGAQIDFGACAFHTEVLDERFDDDVQMKGLRKL